MIRASMTVKTSTIPGTGIARKSAKVIQNLMAELRQAGEALKSASQALAPVLTGALRESCRVQMLGNGSSRTVWVTYGVPYAVYVHENMEIHHPQHGDRDCGGQAKFLEQPAREMGTGFRIRAVEAIR